ncbi:MAG: GGDEF domain-containing protein, partial [Clostridia bacterium]|nr:GGDEF domain-containing protein [Clostridia bacterium]
NNSLQLEVIRRVEEIERSNRRLLEISKTDSMTGLYIKSALLANLENTIERAPQAVFSLLMFDIDKFKTINDTMGHQVGDRCIKNIAALAQGSFRNEDILARYGGDEFIILLPSTPPVKAFIIADRFRQTIEKQANPKITISVGVSSYPADGQTPAALIEAADKALYASKQKGRNQVTLYSSLVSAVEDKAKVQDHDNERH